MSAPGWAPSIADDDQRVALLVLGDGSACRSEKAPGYFDARAEPFDAGVARALADADAQALLDLDADLAGQLQCAGRAPWQVLAGGVRPDGRSWQGRLHYDEAPYGVAYFVATWSAASDHERRGRWSPSSGPRRPARPR